MQFIIFEQLSCLAHLQHNTQPSHFWLVLSTIIMYTQYISIILPSTFKYQDGHLSLLKQLSEASIIIPLGLYSDIDFSSLALICLLLLLTSYVTIFIIFVIFGFYDNISPVSHYSVRRFIYYFIMFTTTIFQLPILFLLLSFLLINHNNFTQDDTFLNWKSILSLITLLLYTIFVIMQQYFLRSYTFIPFNYLQSKFNGLQLIQYIFNILTTLLHLLHQNSFIQYGQIAILFFQFLLRLIEMYYSKPYIPFLNQLHFSMSFTNLIILLLISINMFSENQDIMQENQLIYAILTLGSIAFSLAKTFYNTKCLSTFDQEINSYTCISFTQEMHFKYLHTLETPKSKEFFQLYLYWKAHKIVCDKHWPNQKTDYNQIQRTHQTIFCILNTELEKNRNEDLLLFYISYLGSFCKKPLLAFVELKRYQQWSKYFSFIRNQASLHLQRLIQKQQEEYKQHDKQQLSIQSIFQALQFHDIFIPKVIELLNDKIIFWTRQIKGFQTIYELERLAIAQSNKILKLGQEINSYCDFDIKNIDHLQISNNVQDMKLISIFCSSILNDYYSTQICENAITEVFNIEHTLSEDTITNLSFIQERAVIVMLSLVKHRGKIINRDRKLIAQFFNYSDQEFSQVDNVSSLMPQFFAEKHDKFLINYLQTSKSQFFEDYRQIFGQNKQGLIVSYQLKLDNNFTELDDYVLIGCLSQVKRSSDYVLFGEDGFIIGTTENFHSNIISNQKIDTQLNIFFLIPNLIEQLNELKNNYGKDQINIQQDKYCRIWKYFNIKDLIEASQKLGYSCRQNSFLNDSSLLKSRASFASIEKEKANIIIYQQLGQSITTNKKMKGITLLQSMTVYSVPFNTQLLQQLSFLEYKNKTNYVGRMNLTFKVVGKKENRRGYFILEINDIRKGDELNTESLANNPNTYSLQTTYKINSVQEPISEIGIINVNQEEVTPNLQQMNQYQRLLNKLENKPQQYSDFLGMESGRDSISYGPLSQRVNFISPSSKQQHIQEFIDKDFMDLQNQLEQGEDGLDNLEMPDSSKIKSNSKDVNQKSNNIIEILQNNKLNQNKIDREIQKSKSSITSGTSGVSAMSTIKKFQQKTEMTNTLRILTIINTLILIIMIIYIIVHLIKLNDYNKQTRETLININAPTLFNRYFFKTFTYTWSLVFNSLKIIESSEFLIQQTISEMKQLASEVFIDLNNMYDVFIGIEQSGMLNKILMDFLYQESENVTYTYFINLISNVAKELYQALNYNVDTLIQLIDRNYMDNLLLLRYNLKNVIDMNFWLIDSLNDVFFMQLDDVIQEFQIQIIIEIILICIIIKIQLIYWKMIEQYCQQLLILAGRLQINQAQEQITRFTAVIETLQQISGKQGWKRQNFYKLLYFPLNQIGIDTMQAQSKILKDFQISQLGMQTNKVNHMLEDRSKIQKKNLNVVLNSKINNPNTSIFSATIKTTITCLIFLLYILGGYLLFQKQQNDLLPTQQLTLSFIRFTSKLDIVVSTALITKSQPLLYEKLVQIDIYTQEELDSFRDERVIIKTFISLYDIYYENISSIYQNIIESNKINNEDEITLLSLYQGNFCDLLSSSIPFCNYDKITNFNLLYGQSQTKDDNRDYLSKGIQGVVSKLDTFFKQNYYYEINNTNYVSNLTTVKDTIRTKEFTNSIMEHFLDTTDGTNMFIDNIMDTVNKITIEDLKLLYTYYLVTGIFILILFIIFYGCWIQKTNQRLIMLRLILTNLPIEVLTEQHTLSLLKKLQ